MWTSIQLGSREHYAIAVALHASGRLDALITDTWISKGQQHWARRLHPSWGARRHDALPDDIVMRSTLGRLAVDFSFKLRGISGWPSFMIRNEWFGNWAAEEVLKLRSSHVFSYSYTAQRVFKAAKSFGGKCVLGQIDPGPREEDIVEEQTAAYCHLAHPANRAPKEYWNLWREEVALADAVVVNSPWSAKLLSEAGVPSEKLVEVPLVYEPSGSMEQGARGMEKKSNTRLQALFLGSVILRKGVGQLFDAIKLLRNEPVDFTFAGPIGVSIPDEISRLPNVRFLGPVDKATAGQLYREADVFLFPTLSDGFGLTQLEALANGLPVIASTHCGQVVQDRVSGLVLPEVSPEVIADAIMQLVRDGNLLDRLKANARVPEKCHPRHLAPALLALESF